MNKVILIGNLVADPEMRTTQSGISQCTIRIAVQRRFANAQGVRESDFFNCIAWRQTADFIGRFFTKGRKIGIEGSLQTRTYDAQDGSKRTVTEIMIDNAEFVDSKPSGDGMQPRQYGQAPAAAPAAPAVTPQAPQSAPGGFTDFDDDELPF